MMTKRLFSIILMCMLLMPLSIQAADIGVPVYEVDVTHSVIGNGSGDIVAAIAAQSTETMRMQSVANITLEPAEILAESVKYNLHKSIAVAGIIGVSGGDSIGIRPIG